MVPRRPLGGTKPFMLVEYKTSSTRADTGTQHSVGIMYFHPLIKWSDSTFGFEYFLNDRLVYIFHKSSQSHKAFVTRFVEVCFHSNQRWRKMYNQRIDRTKKEKKTSKNVMKTKIKDFYRKIRELQQPISVPARNRISWVRDKETRGSQPLT